MALGEEYMVVILSIALSCGLMHNEVLGRSWNQITDILLQTGMERTAH